MRDLKRKIYRRGSSFEVTIPKYLLYSLDFKKKYNIVFKLVNKRWVVDFELSKKKVGLGELRRRIYKRGNSYETTLPLPLLFGLDENKDYYLVFRFFENKWLVDFEEVVK